MVYESDFYTTRRPYRYTPSYSTYTTTTVPSRQVRVLPGLGKVHIVHSYDRIVPYVGHKRLTVVTTPKVFTTSSAILRREYDWIENRIRPWVAYSAVNNYLNSDSAVKYGSRIHWTNYLWEYWPYYRSYLNRLTSPFLYKNYYFDTYWFDRYLDWKYNLYPRYSSRFDRRMVSYRSPLYGLSYYYRNYLPISNIKFDHYWPYTTLNYLTKWWPKYYDYDYDDDDLSYRTLRIQRIFENEKNLIRAQTASLMKSVHLPVPRYRSQPLVSLNRYGEYPARLSNDHYINRLMQISPKNSKVQFITYYTEPVKKYIGQGHLSCISYVGDRGSHNRRRNVYVYEDPVKNDIQLLSFYINKFRQEKEQKSIESTKAPLSPSRPSRRFNSKHHIDIETPQEIKELREARAARLAKINAPSESQSVENVLLAKKKQEEARLAEETAAAEAQAAQEAKEKKEREAREAEKAAELKRQEELAKQQAELEKLREEEEKLRLQEEKVKKEEEERKKLEEEQKKAEEERLKAEEERLKAEEERLKAEEERLRIEEEERQKAEEKLRLEEEEKRRAEEEREQLLRLEEIARQAEEEKERELVRQAEELAELARQEAELAELAKQEAELSELKKQEEELAELERKEELETLEKRLEEKSVENEETAITEDKLHDDEIPIAPSHISEENQEESTAQPHEVEELDEEDEPIAEAEETIDAQENTADEAEEEEE